MHRFRLSRVLLCGLLSFHCLMPSVAGQTANPAKQEGPKLYRKWWNYDLSSHVMDQERADAEGIPAPYQKWLDEDVRYLINNEERVAFAKLASDQERDKFVEQFWERRNPNPGSSENPFKEERYRRLAYANQHFPEGVPGFKTDRGRIYITYGPPDEQEQHPGKTGAAESYPSHIWRYHTLKRAPRNVDFEFTDKCRCDRYELTRDPTQEWPEPSSERVIPAKTVFQRAWQKWLNQDVRHIISNEEREQFYELENDAQRDEFVEKFWDYRNPNPSSKENVFKEEHYRRIGYANKNFDTPHLAGWKTDRGRIYIIYGPPAEREEHPSSADSHVPSASSTVNYPSDVWRYHFI